ncbi:hypothetical protein ANO11243_087630 [Dothideomycetidae sp. 11243]|nr:hypothetical protein ANO11243_087630 [fungal sp. No.11243]
MGAGRMATTTVRVPEMEDEEEEKTIEFLSPNSVRAGMVRTQGREKEGSMHVRRVQPNSGVRQAKSLALMASFFRPRGARDRARKGAKRDRRSA